MYGAILGDIIGSPYEFDQGDKTKDFPLFTDLSMFTDDSIMTLAVAEAFMDSLEKGEDLEKNKKRLIRYMQFWGEKYPNAGYGAQFAWWIVSGSTKPYNSYGNGSAMRVSSVGWLYDDLDTVLRMAKLSAEVTHNHPEGIKGAQVTASAIFLARTGYTKEEIKEYLEILFEYDLNRTCDEIRPTYYHKESCQETVPEAIIAFLESTDFEDAIRNAVSLGGDCDTLTCITGSIAEAFYGVPEELKKECLGRLTNDLKAICFNDPSGATDFLSNWYVAGFTVAGYSYFAMEQYVAHQKALTFGDLEIAQKVMQSFDFEEMKALGRQVRNYDNTVWNGIRQIVVYEGLLAKFSQNPELKQKLLDTARPCWQRRRNTILSGVSDCPWRMRKIRIPMPGKARTCWASR